MGIVIINGKRYDSVTGLMLSDQVDNTSLPKTDKSINTNQLPGWVNNYVDEENTANQARSVSNSNNGSNTTNSTDHRRSSASAIRRTAGQSRTLNRRFVQKPLSEAGEYAESIATSQLRQADKVASMSKATETANETINITTREASENFVPILTRRQAESLSKLTGSKPLHVRVAEAEEAKRTAEMKSANVKQPVAIPVNQSVKLSTANIQNDFDDDILNERLSSLSQILQNAAELDNEQGNHNENKQSSVNNSSNQKNKTSDKSNKRTRRSFSPRAIFATAGSIAVIVGLGVYIVMPDISVKMAANKAGIDAKNPYAPAGYSIDGEVAYTQGSVTINYRRSSGNDGYSITQQSSSDSNATIRQKIASESDGYYQETTIGDKTIYTYQDNITWLNNGIQYTIDSNDYLDSEQINNIVDSL